MKFCGLVILTEKEFKQLEEQTSRCEKCNVMEMRGKIVELESNLAWARENVKGLDKALEKMRKDYSAEVLKSAQLAEHLQRMMDGGSALSKET